MYILGTLTFISNNMTASNTSNFFKFKHLPPPEMFKFGSQRASNTLQFTVTEIKVIIWSKGTYIVLLLLRPPDTRRLNTLVIRKS